jgi:hypothetical protein
MVQTGDITIDGAGHTLEGNREVTVIGINLVGHDEAYSAYRDVLVKNLRIYNFFEGIFTVGSNNNSFIGNYFDNAGMHIQGGDYIGNVIKHNIFKNSGIFVDYNSGGLDIVTENNFIDSTIFVDLSAPPIVDKNYWSNYTANYPEAEELDSSGIWNTPYVYDKFVGGSHGKDPCIDYHPLVNPINNFEIPDFSIPIPTPTPTPTPTNTSFAREIPLQTTAVILAASAIALTIGLFVYFKKRKHYS